MRVPRFPPSDEIHKDNMQQVFERLRHYKALAEQKDVDLKATQTLLDTTHKENADLRKRLDLLERKIEHGCVNGQCPLCDKAE